MSEINSPLGRKAFAESGQRVLTVDDESEATEGPVQLTREQFNTLVANRREMTAAQKRPSPEARTRVEILAGIGRAYKEFECEGIKFTLQSLRTKDLREVLLSVSNSNKLDFNFEVRGQTLARSLCKIDGQPVEFVLGDNKIESRLEFFDNLDESVVQFIYSKYTELSDEVKKKFGIQTTEEAKELVEDIKK